MGATGGNDSQRICLDTAGALDLDTENSDQYHVKGGK